MFLVSIGVSGAIDKQIFPFFDWIKKQMQFYIWQGTAFTSKRAKKTQKLIGKRDIREHFKTQFIGTKKNSSNDNYCKKEFHENSCVTLGPEEG